MKDIILNRKSASLNFPLVMGILNLTPDSFYDGGKYLTKKDIKERVAEIINDGAEIIDVGAYSSRPGAEHISEKEELARLLPAIDIIKEFFPKAIFSIDTFRASVVNVVFKKYGAFIVNDISGGTMDENMYNVVAKYNLPYIMMHIKGTPQNMQLNPTYKDLMGEIVDFFREGIEKLKELGHSQIIIDPGFGFAKTLEHNYQLLREMDKLKCFNLPILVGVSRKSMICKLLKCNPSKALTGTITLNTIALDKGADIIRVHDVREGVETVSVFKAYKSL